MQRSTPRSFVQPWRGEIQIAADHGLTLDGTLEIPANALGLVLFAHGSGSSRHSPRHRHVARALQDGALATLLFDLLTREEERSEKFTGHLRFDLEFLAARLRAASRWAMQHDRTAPLRLGYFGASTGAGAALIAVTESSLAVGAVVSRGGRPDLAGEALLHVRAPTLLIVGGDDPGVIDLNEEAFARLTCRKQLEIVPGASHLFEETGTLDTVAQLATRWFAENLPAQGWHP